MTDTIQHCDPTKLRLGTNYRKHLGDIEELADSLIAVGMLQPLVCRPTADAAAPVDGNYDEEDLEVAIGFRRHAGALKVKLASVPVIVRQYTDDQLLESQIVENSARADVDPLDEAEGFAELRRRNYEPHQIAAKIGRPSAYVAQRLRLCQLSEEASEALHDEKITLGVALLVAKLPTKELQNKALDLVAVDYEGDGPMPVAFAKKRIELEVMRDLTAAPFDRVSTELVPPAGSCSACPKRTGAQAELFGDGTSPDLCTDPVCYRSKLDAHWANAQAEAKAKGLEVLTKAKAEQATRHHSGGESGFQRLDDHVYIGSKKRTVRQLLGGKDAEPVAIARDEQTGIPVELVAKRDVDAAVKAARAAAGEKDPEGPSDFQRKAAEERKAAKARRAALLEALVAKFDSSTKVSLELLRALAYAAVELASSEARNAAVKRRGLTPLSDTPNNLLLKLTADREMRYGRMLSLLVELLLTSREDAFARDDGEGLGSGLVALSAVELSEGDILGRDAKPGKPAAKPKKTAPKPKAVTKKKKAAKSPKRSKAK